MTIPLIIIIISVFCIYLFISIDIESNNQRVKQNTKKLLEEYDKIVTQSSEAKTELSRSAAELSAIKDNINQYNDTLSNLKNLKEEMEAQADKEAEKYYLQQIDLMKERVDSEYQSMIDDYNQKISSLTQLVEQEEQKMKDLESKQNAYIEAQKRKEAIAANKDYYRLAIDEESLDDISTLRNFQRSFTKKEIIDKVIYEGYYRPLYNTLMSHLFENKTKVSGIYKLTDQITGQVYIGQSLDMQERLKIHIKTALAHGQGTNKLYQAMKKDGVHNFTFEILEEVPRDKLNEREVYWIEFYRAKEQLNSTRGGS